MHLPKAECVLAIYGPSRVGKTRLAKELGIRLELPVRHCGYAVRTRAAELGMGPGQLPLAEHRVIDAETRRIALGQRVIVEGRYVDSALVGIGGVKLVRLTSTETARAARSETALSDDERIARLRSEDEHDEKLRLALYKGVIAATSWLTLDTTDARPEELADRILAKVARCDNN